MTKSARGNPVGACGRSSVINAVEGNGALGDPRGFGGLGPTSPEGSDFQGAVPLPPMFN